MPDVKIIFVNRFFFPDASATSQLLSDLAFHLAGRGREVHVVASRLRYEGGARHAREETVRGVRVHRVRSSAFGRQSSIGRALDYASFLWFARRAVARLAQRGDVVVAMTDPPLIAPFIGALAARRGAAWINWIQDLYPEIAERAGMLAPGGAPARLLRGLRDRGLARAAFNVVVGESIADTVRGIGAVRAESVRVIHNWADGAAITPLAARDNPLRRSLGYAPGDVIAGYSGNLGRVHDFETIAGAAALLRDHPRLKFLVVGGGSGLERLRERVAAQGLGNVRFLPYQDRSALSASLAAIDIHLCTLDPRFEALVLPSKLYGIMAAGRPCLFIGDPAGESARIVAGFGAALRPGSAHELAAMLAELAASPQRREAMGTRARAAFDAAYDRPRAMRQWEALLELAGGPPHRPTV